MSIENQKALQKKMFRTDEQQEADCKEPTGSLTLKKSHAQLMCSSRTNSCACITLREIASTESGHGRRMDGLRTTCFKKS